MSKSTRARTRFAAAIVVILGTVVGVDVAHADTVGGAISGTTNSSDPELFLCPNSTGSNNTICMYVSHDVGHGATKTNYYPMDKTFIYKLKDGLDPAQAVNWDSSQILADANICGSGKPVVCGANHLWAPGGRYYHNQYVVYVPDLTDTSESGQHNSSVIEVFASSVWAAPGSGCGPSGCLGSYNYQGAMTNMPHSLNTGYASDPFFYSYVESSGAETNYLVWANGDNSNCGGISMGKLNSLTEVANGAGPISIVNWKDNMGTCVDQNGNDKNRPYLEGAALYRTADIGGSTSLGTYTMIFAAKPRNKPTGCDSSNEAISYAQSSSITGPYVYRGVIMCGSQDSSGGEWTNQSSVVRDPMSGRYLFAYHDGPHADGTDAHSPNRKVHLQCLKWDSAGKAIRVERSTTNLSNC